MKRIKKLLTVLLSVLLLASLLPTGVMAAGESADWASSAVAKLNEIYGGTSFSASTDKMTEGDAASIAKAVGWTTTKVTDSSSTELTRSKACEVLAEVFSLDLSDKSAIQYLYDRNIINGTDASGTLNENGPVSHAEFAVLTYRVLNAVGGGEGSNNEALKPGTKEHFAWMYLAARACVPFNSTQLGTVMENVSFTFNGNNVSDGGESDTKGEEVWDKWKTRLGEDLHITIGNTAQYSKDSTVSQNAVALVSDISSATQIFSDVKASDWYYDGIMYLFDRGLVSGNGDGTFGTSADTPRFQLAVLLARADGTLSATDGGYASIRKAVANAVDKKYMTGDKLSDSDPASPDDMSTWLGAWNTTATREEATVAILKMIEETENIDTTSDNLAILDRFTDKRYCGSFQALLGLCRQYGIAQWNQYKYLVS